MKVQLALNSDQSTFQKAKSWFKSLFKGKPKVTEQIIGTKQQFTFKGEDEKPHDIMLIKLNQDVSVKLPVIKLPPVDCAKPEQGKEVKIGGFGAKKAGGKGEKHLRYWIQFLKINENH